MLMLYLTPEPALNQVDEEGFCLCNATTISRRIRSGVQCHECSMCDLLLDTKLAALDRGRVVLTVSIGKRCGVLQAQAQSP